MFSSKFEKFIESHLALMRKLICLKFFHTQKLVLFPNVSFFEWFTIKED